ncbi:MAG TPA: FtsX-like permease family protein [Candidatus Angelobacter sp.]
MRIARQILTESLLLAALGSVVGLTFARLAVYLLVSSIPTSIRAFMPYLQQAGLDARVLVFTFAASLVTGILFGLGPALQSSRRDPQGYLKQEGNTSRGSARQRLRSVLVACEFAAAVILLAGAGLMMKSTFRLLRTDPGFNTHNLLTLRTSMPGSTAAANSAFYQALMDRVAALPGVDGVATVNLLPLGGGGNTGSLTIVGRPANDPNIQSRSVHVRDISASYFHTLGIPLLRGREFSYRDNPDAPKSVVVNENLVHCFFPGQNPIGQRISFVWAPGPWEIVGVVANEKVVSPDSDVTSVVYFPALVFADSDVDLMVRSSSDAGSMAAAIRQEVRALNHSAVVSDVLTMEQVIEGSPAVFMRRYPALLIGSFAGIALLLALVGIYGLVSYSVLQQTHEIGIRAALGARRFDLVKVFVGRNFILASAGILVGLAGAVALTRFLSSLLYSIQPTDPLTFAGVGLALAATGLLGSYLPARRAVKVDPMVILRHE